MGDQTAQPIRRFSVVIPARNASHHIRDQLSALAGQTYRGCWEIIVADNGSTDGTADCVREMADRLPDLRVVDASRRRGPSHARNVGARAARGDYLLFVDADDRVRATWLTEMARAASDFDAIGGRIIAYFVRDDGTKVIEAASDGFKTVFEFWPFVPAGNFGIRADLFHALG
jgi:glycosyltransferase involved in cell wall biosynthesis